MKKQIRTIVVFLCMLLLSGCSFPGIIETSAQLPNVPQVEEKPNLPPVRFPEDEGAHQKLTEWWYYTGHFQSSTQGRNLEYGFEMVVFRVLRSDLPPFYVAHFAITDLGRGEFHYDQRRVSQSPQAAAQPQAGINEQVGDWQIVGLDGNDHLQANMQNYAINLQLHAEKGPALHNENGIVPYGNQGYSYYYSRTRMSVSGSIEDHQQLEQVSGQAWMDHQWGDFLTSNGGGWDWYSLQLDNQTELILYYVRDPAGKTVGTYAAVIDKDGKQIIFTDQQFSLKALDSWLSQETHIRYPSGWLLEITDPRFPLSLTIQPRLKNQELNVLSTTGNIYWEGAVSLEGSLRGESVRGQGYVELTGYPRV